MNGGSGVVAVYFFTMSVVVITAELDCVLGLCFRSSGVVVSFLFCGHYLS